MALVLLYTFATSMEASIVRSRLGAEGIDAYLFDVEDEWNTVARFNQPIRLMIAEEDQDRATATLAQMLQGGFQFGDGD